MSVNVDVKGSKKKVGAAHRAAANRDRRRPKRSQDQTVSEEAKLVTIVILANLFCIFIQPDFMQYLYVSSYPFLLLQRIVSYFKLNYQFFLIDFCYFIHLMLIYFIFFDEVTNSIIFSILWISCVGWCSFSVIVWNNKLYFNLELFFSFYLHFMPSLIMCCLQNLIKDHKLQFYFFKGLGFSILYFVFVSFIQYIILLLFKKKENINASYCYLTYKFAKLSNIKFLKHKFTIQYIQNNFHFCYILCQFGCVIFLILTGFVSKVLYDYWWLHAILLMSLFVLGLKRAIDLYKDQITKKYEKFSQQYKDD